MWPSVDDLTVTFQTPALLPWLSVEENALLPYRLSKDKGTNRRPSLDYLEELLETTGLLEFRASYPHELSGGMAMRAAVVRAFLPSPGLVLMDEPFAALDEITRERMCGLLERIWMNTKNTVIFVTHNLTEAVLLSDRISVFSPRPGQMIAEVQVPFARPRSLAIVQSMEFQTIVSQVRNAIREGNDNGG